MLDEHKNGLYIAKVASSRDASNGFVAMSSSSHQCNHRVKLHQRFSPEADVCAWLRDEPIDIATSSFLQSGSGTAVGKTFNSFVGTHDNTGQLVTDGSGSPRYKSDLTDEAAVQRKGSSQTARLHAQLKATRIKESTLLEGIQRLGGGQKGLRAVVRAILFWLEAKNLNNSQSMDPCVYQSEIVTSRLEEIGQISWSNYDCGSIVDAQPGHVGTLNHSSLNNASPADFNCLLNLTSMCRDNDGNLCDLRPRDHGSGEYSGVPNHESQSPAFMGEPEAGGRLLDGLRSRGSSPAGEDMTAGDWVPPMREYLSRHEKSHRTRMIRKLSPSPDCSAVHCAHDVIAYDETLNRQSKIRRRSPTHASYPSSQSSNEFPAYLSTATPAVSEVLGASGSFGAVGANPFAPGGPFNLSPSSPPTMDLQSLDFNSFGTQRAISIDDNLGLGSSVQGCGLIDRLGSLGYSLSSENSVDRKHSGSRLGVTAKSKASPAACTRLARKQRMDRNRKAASFQVNRFAFEAGALFTGKSGGMCSSGSVRSICRSQGSPASEGTTRRTVDRRDHENLQFLLLKVLRPSDVGNLGRIVLPKKDAESHLPWLGAREGIQFACEDYDTGEMMTLRYRFWPNNKSRMYLLENTGDFIKKHHLQESDRMLIYRNQQQGPYIIRACKAQDCLDGLSSLGHSEGLEGDAKESSRQNLTAGPCCSGTSSLSETKTVVSGHHGASESFVPVPAVITSQDDLLDFTDLPDAPMGEGTDNLVRFPSLESFDVELLELAPVPAKKEDVMSCGMNLKEE